MNEELLDELYDTLTRLCHFYNGMMREIASESYGREQAERDWTALMHNEGMDAIPILAEMLDRQETVGTA